ncbi:hypothetical protein BT69DRAFT_1304980 [Atractiella rhizophila]|nr:hypothetical protein BT69DRAFT_1304980 [Atractiella rhizophila]
MHDLGLPDANLTVKHEPMKALDQSREPFGVPLCGSILMHWRMRRPNLSAEHILQQFRTVPSDLGAFVLAPGYLYCRNHQVYVHPEAKEKLFTQKSHKLAGHTKKHIIAQAIRRLPEPIKPPEAPSNQHHPSRSRRYPFNTATTATTVIASNSPSPTPPGAPPRRGQAEVEVGPLLPRPTRLPPSPQLQRKPKIITHVQPPEMSQQHARTESLVPTLAQVPYSETRPEHLPEGQQSRSLIQKSVRSPVGDKDRPELARLFQHLKDHVEGWHQNIWKHGSGRIGERLMEHRAGVDRLKNFGRKLEPGTYAKYAATFGRFISFILHCTRKRAGQRHKYGYPEIEEDIEAKADSLYRHIEGLGEGSPPEDEPLLDLCQAIFKPRATKDPRTDLAVEFLMRTSMSPQGTWGGDDRVTQPVSHLQFWIRLVAFRIYERKSAKLPRDGSTVEAVELLAGEAQKLTTAHDHNTMGRVTWVKTLAILMARDDSLATSTFAGWTKRRRDELGKRDLGYNFLQDPKNGLSEHFLDFFTKMTPEVKKKMRDASSGRWKTAETEKFVSRAEKMLTKIITLCCLCWGGPAPRDRDRAPAAHQRARRRRTEEHLLGEGHHRLRDAVQQVAGPDGQDPQGGEARGPRSSWPPAGIPGMGQAGRDVRGAATKEGTDVGSSFFASLRPNGERVRLAPTHYRNAQSEVT